MGALGTRARTWPIVIRVGHFAEQLEGVGRGGGGVLAPGLCSKSATASTSSEGRQPRKSVEDEEEEVVEGLKEIGRAHV